MVDMRGQTMGRSTRASTMIAVTIITVEINTVMIIAVTIIRAVEGTLIIGRVRETTPLLPITIQDTTLAQGIGMHSLCYHPQRTDTNYLLYPETGDQN